MNETDIKTQIGPLLAPIPGDHPGGEYLRYEGTYDRIQEARREDDPNLPQGEWKTALKRANWPEVQRVCRDALQNRSKDLQLAAWLTEAWTVLKGLQGAILGVHLVTALCHEHWEHLFPELDGDDASFRLSPVDWLEQRLPLRLKSVPITKPGDGYAYSYADLELATHREKESRRDPDNDSSSEPAEDDPRVPTTARFRVSASLTPRPILLGLIGDCKALEEALVALDAEVTARAGSGAISLRQLRETTAAIRVELQQAAGDVGPSTGADSDAGDEEPQEHDMSASDGDPATEDAGGAARGGPIKTRAQAYQRLIEAADYLMRTEPHSPTPYLVKRAVAWGRMSLTELLSEIVNTPEDLNSIFSLLGIRGRGGAE